MGATPKNVAPIHLLTHIIYFYKKIIKKLFFCYSIKLKHLDKIILNFYKIIV